MNFFVKYGVVWEFTFSDYLQNVKLVLFWRLESTVAPLQQLLWCRHPFSPCWLDFSKLNIFCWWTNFHVLTFKLAQRLGRIIYRECYSFTNLGWFFLFSPSGYSHGTTSMRVHFLSRLFWAIPHLFERLFLLRWENIRHGAPNENIVQNHLNIGIFLSPKNFLSVRIP